MYHLTKARKIDCLSKRINLKHSWSTAILCDQRCVFHRTVSNDSLAGANILASWEYGSRIADSKARVELVVIDDLSNPNKSHKFADFVLNSANEALVGTQASYFPRGGVKHEAVNSAPWEASSRWCGMEIGSDMVYPYQSCDGLIHQACGQELLDYIRKNVPVLSKLSSSENKEWRCRPGEVVWTPSFGQLQQVYPYGIFHAVAPYFSSKTEEWHQLLLACYTKTFNFALHQRKIRCAQYYANTNSENARRHQFGELGEQEQASMDPLVLAVPFLGTGVRGAPLTLGVSVAAVALEQFFITHNFIAQEWELDSSRTTRKPVMTIRYVTHHKDEHILNDMVEALAKFAKARNGNI